jgi:hypothetical protein
MAQTEEFLDEGIAAIIDTLQTEATHIVCMTDSTPCTAAKNHTHASPADTLVVDSGLADQAIDTVGEDDTNTTGDTITIDHVFTASGTKNVSGIQVTNDTPDASYAEVCFNAIVPMESSDTLTIDGEAVIDQA